MLTGGVVFGVTEAAPDGVFDTDGVVLKAPDTADGGKSGDKSLLVDVLVANRAATKLADRPCFLFTLDTLHWLLQSRRSAAA